MPQPAKSAGTGDGRSLQAVAPLRPVQDDTMRRVQIGIAGIVIVLLLVGMAGLLSERARENVTMAAEAAPEAKMVTSSNNTPLEELGVQPVAKDGGANASSAAADTASAPLPADVGGSAPRSSVPDLEPDPALDRARQAKN